MITCTKYVRKKSVGKHERSMTIDFKRVKVEGKGKQIQGEIDLVSF